MSWKRNALVLAAGLSLAGFVTWKASDHWIDSEGARAKEAAHLLAMIPLHRAVLQEDLAKTLEKATGVNYRAALSGPWQPDDVPTCEVIVRVPIGTDRHGFLTFVFEGEDIGRDLRLDMDSTGKQTMPWRQTMLWRRIE